MYLCVVFCVLEKIAVALNQCATAMWFCTKASRMFCCIGCFYIFFEKQMMGWFLQVAPKKCTVQHFAKG